jgi:hypothetical protein
MLGRSQRVGSPHPSGLATPHPRFHPGRYRPALAKDVHLTASGFPRESPNTGFLAVPRLIFASLIRLIAFRATSQHRQGGVHLTTGAWFRMLPSVPDLVMPPLFVRLASPWRKVGEVPPRAGFSNLRAPFNMHLTLPGRRSHMLEVGGYTLDLQPNLSASVASTELPFILPQDPSYR